MFVAINFHFPDSDIDRCAIFSILPPYTFNFTIVWMINDINASSTLHNAQEVMSVGCL